jgi:hypothetical protein
MAHYAFLNSANIVIEVICGVDETETIEGIDPETWYGEFRNLVCKRTSYNNNIRKQFAGIGFSYDPLNDVFIVPKPYPSWILDENFDWQAPVPKPINGEWIWNESEGDWNEFVP